LRDADSSFAVVSTTPIHRPARGIGPRLKQPGDLPGFEAGQVARKVLELGLTRYRQDTSLKDVPVPAVLERAEEKLLEDARPSRDNVVALASRR
jgi:hypothetical protein